MEGSHLSIGCDIETHIAIGSCPKTKGIGLKILGLPPEAASQVVQHAFHGNAPLPLMGKRVKKYGKGIQHMPVA